MTAALLARLEAAAASRDSAAADIRNARVQLQRELYSPRSNSSGSAPGGMGMPAMMDQAFTNPMQSMMGMRNRGSERTSDLVGAETTLAQATTRYKSAEANIKEIQSMLRDTQGVAQFSGVIQKVHVEVGDTVQPGQPLLDFSESAALKVEADLPVRLSRTLQPGQLLDVALAATACCRHLSAVSTRWPIRARTRCASNSRWTPAAAPPPASTSRSASPTMPPTCPPS